MVNKFPDHNKVAATDILNKVPGHAVNPSIGAWVTSIAGRINY